MKKATAIAVMLAMALSLTSCDKAEDTSLIGRLSGKVELAIDFEYEENDTEITILKCKSKDTQIIIPDEINGKPVTEIGKIATENENKESVFSSKITSVTLSHNTETIGNYAFNGCTGLTSITLPDSVNTIGCYAFKGCTGLEKAVIPQNVIEIGEYAFENCKNLKSLTLQNHITAINAGVFSNCNNLTDITLPREMNKICSRAFSDCTSLETLDIPNSVVEINGYAFENCKNLKSITLPNNIPEIEVGVFSGCTNLTDITIPNAVKAIGYVAFKGCEGLTDITLPNGITEIGSHAFNGCTGLTKVSVPNSITEIGSNAFENCTNLKSIALPDKINTIKVGTFSGCTNLTDIKIPNSVTKIEFAAFMDCASLENIVIPENVKEIGKDAFKGCPYSNTENETAANITSEPSTLSDFEYYDDGYERYYIEKYIGNDSVIVIPDKINGFHAGNINAWAFASCGATSVIIPDSVTFISPLAFENSTCDITYKGKTYSPDQYSELCDAANNAGTQTAAGYDFKFTEYDTTIVLNKYIGSDTTVIVPSEINGKPVTNLADAFAYSNVKKVIIPEGISVLSNGTFACCYNLESVTLPDSVNSIIGQVFYNCPKLSEINIPDHYMLMISEDSFEKCPGLADYDFSDYIMWT
ncbi:MAG: leucine-rich repeat protein [Muribaculaceae bacterium]|nr:leucine-rich repeat protein [Muribaculaceae bacterium]